MKTNSFRPLGWTSADAAGLPILPGLVRPDEGLPVSQGGQGVINHAIRFTLQNSKILNQFIYPASHVANPGNNNPAIRAADGRAVPAQGERRYLRAQSAVARHRPGDERLRPDRGRQRQQFLFHRREPIGRYEQQLLR